MGTQPSYIPPKRSLVRRGIYLLWRRKALISLIIFTSMCASWVYLSLVRPIYTASAEILIDRAFTTQGTHLSMPVAVMGYDDTRVMNEAGVLRSRSLVSKVITHSGLAAQDELYFSHNHGRIQGFKGLSLKTGLLPDQQDVVTERLIDQFLHHLRVDPYPESSVLRITYRAHDPEFAAKAVNTLIDIYLAKKLEDDVLVYERSLNWLEQRLSTLSQNVTNAEKALDDYISSEKLKEEAVSHIDKDGGDDARVFEDEVQPHEVMAIVMQTPQIQNMKLRETELKGELAELSKRYGHKHPRIINVKTLLQTIQENILIETKALSKSLSHQGHMPVAFKAVDKPLPLWDVNDTPRFRALMRQVESDRLVYQTFLKTYDQARADQQLPETPTARVLSLASIPDTPSYPDKLLIFTIVFCMAALLGILFSICLERLHHVFRHAAQVEDVTGHPCLAMIPLVEGLNKSDIADYVLSKPDTGLAEAIRTLRTVLRLRGGDDQKKPKVIAFTSSFPGEGKTTISTWLARTAAKSGEKVMLIDCDLRRPAISGMVQSKGNKTLVDYLTDQAKLEDIIQRDIASGLHMIQTRAVPNSALDLIGSDKMGHLMDSLKKVYDVIILDTPACMPVSDARVLARLADQTVYCVQWNRTPEEVVRAGTKQFNDIGYHALAFILTGVDVEKHARFGYGDTVMYAHQYQPYDQY